ncbi:TRAP transporter small permease [Thioclava sp. FR2]|uniref:TRAP transporter small permease n=1 Tax=Thioclava sp. FR2 TaxID=3445780 RepID=UPI003EBD6E37
MVSTLRKWMDRLIGLSAFIGAIALFIEICVIMTDVVGRAAKAPLYGSQDLITMVMVLLVFGGMAICDRQGGHITVDILERQFPTWFNRTIDIFTALLGGVIFLFIAWAVYDSAKLSVMLNIKTNLLLLPKAWFQWALALISAFTGLAMLLRAVELAVYRRDIRINSTETDL